MSALVERTKSPHAMTPRDLGQLAGSLAARISEHESSEMRLLSALA